ARRARVGAVAAAGRGGLAELRQVVTWDAEVAQPLEAAQAGELARALDRVAADRAAEAVDRLGDELPVEAERGGQAERVHRAVRDPVGAADRLGHRVREPAPRPGERVPGVHGAAQ